MSNSLDVLWLSASPSLKCFDRPLLRYLSEHVKIAQWEYCQNQDEGSSLVEAVTLLHDYLKFRDRPIHLSGHGMGGVLGLTYARLHPERVRSLTLLAVAAQPAVTWQAHYYVQRQLFPCSRQRLLVQMVRSLFGEKTPYPIKDLVRALDRDLGNSPSMHSLFKLVNLPMGGVSMPLLVCGSRTAPVVDSSALNGWLTWFKRGDRLWLCPQGRHFFHHFYPQLVGKQILSFWQSLLSPVTYLPTCSKESGIVGLFPSS